MDNGKISTLIATLFLFGIVIFIGILSQNPDILKDIIGLPFYTMVGGLTIAILIGIYDYANPRIKEVIETGSRLQLTRPGIITVIFDLLIITLTIITTTPTLIEPILKENYLLFTVIGLPVLMAILKLLNPRQPQESPENIA
jgi:hypothetical protein